MKRSGQQDLDQYIFKRPEMARLLGISTNALRCRMRKGKCDLEYRFDGRNFLFKRPRAIKDPGPPKTPKEDSHKKLLGNTIGKSKRDTIGDLLTKNTVENLVIKESTRSKASNIIMR